MTFTARNTTGNDLRVQILEHETPFTNLGLLARAHLTTESQVFVFEFVATGSTPNARFRLNMGPHDSSGNDYFIDDVSVVEVPGGMMGIAP